jgi:hypothetical protein
MMLVDLPRPKGPRQTLEPETNITRQTIVHAVAVMWLAKCSPAALYEIVKQGKSNWMSVCMTYPNYRDWNFTLEEYSDIWRTIRHAALRRSMEYKANRGLYRD